MNCAKRVSTCFGILFLVAIVGCSNPADNVTPADVSDAKESSFPADDASDETKTYVINEDSKIEFTGSKVTGSHSGGFNDFEGSFSVADGEILPAEQTVQIDMNLTWSDNERLTGHLTSSDFFAVEEFPTSTFAITAVESTDSGSTVTGNLTLHGVTKSISFPADIQITDEELTLKAEFSIKRFDFDIEYPGRADDLIRDEVVIRLDIKADAA